MREPCWEGEWFLIASSLEGPTSCFHGAKEYFTQGKSPSVTLPLHLLPEPCPVSHFPLVLGVLRVGLAQGMEQGSSPRARGSLIALLDEDAPLPPSQLHVAVYPCALGNPECFSLSVSAAFPLEH